MCWFGIWSPLTSSVSTRTTEPAAPTSLAFSWGFLRFFCIDAVILHDFCQHDLHSFWYMCTYNTRKRSKTPKMLSLRAAWAYFQTWWFADRPAGENTHTHTRILSSVRLTEYVDIHAFYTATHCKWRTDIQKRPRGRHRGEKLFRHCIGFQLHNWDTQAVFCVPNGCNNQYCIKSSKMRCPSGCVGSNAPVGVWGKGVGVWVENYSKARACWDLMK
jgi:hypothetical protein